MALSIGSALSVHASYSDYPTDKLIPVNEVADKQYVQAGTVASRVIASQRKICGLGELSHDSELIDIASRHNAYLQYLHTRIDTRGLNSHYQNKIKNYEKITGDSNPFFTGNDYTDRIISARYKNGIYGGSENIIQEHIYSKNGLIQDPNAVAAVMARGFLSAPYHMQSLLNPTTGAIGISFRVYTPYKASPSQKKGYSLVSATSGTLETSNNKINGLFTYPCQGVVGTVTGLYNEIPSPVEGTGRNLNKDPIGQPILVYMPSVESMKVINIRVHDTQRNYDVPTNLLDYKSDPHKGSEYELPMNKAFILPITDKIKSCKSGRYKNCGLMPHTKYQVSFDAVVDGGAVINKSFVFETGATNRG